jgi:hypothetical protein
LAGLSCSILRMPTQNISKPLDNAERLHRRMELSRILRGMRTHAELLRDVGKQVESRKLAKMSEALNVKLRELEG